MWMATLLLMNILHLFPFRLFSCFVLHRCWHLASSCIDFGAPHSQDPNDKDLVTEAAGSAPVSSWRKAAARAGLAGNCGSSIGQHQQLPGAATTSSDAAARERRSSSPSDNREEGGGSGQGVLLQQRLQTLEGVFRRALRATLIAVHLLQNQQNRQQQQQRQQLVVSGSSAAATQAGSGAVPAAVWQLLPASCGATAAQLLNQLAAVLREQAMCLAPWYEPWRFRPARDRSRQLLLQAAQVRVAGRLAGWLSGCVVQVTVKHGDMMFGSVFVVTSVAGSETGCMLSSGVESTLWMQLLVDVTVVARFAAVTFTALRITSAQITSA